jgi:hypothetical protein
MELGLAFTADAVEHSLVTQSGTELQFITTKENALALNEQDINKAVVHLGGRPMRAKITIGDPGTEAAAPVAPKAITSRRVILLIVLLPSAGGVSPTFDSGRRLPRIREI